MRDFKSGKRHGWMRVATGSLAMAVLAGAALLSAKAAWGMYERFATASAAAAAAQGELRAMQAQYASTTAEVEALGTERGQEEALRQRYGVARPGEGQIDIVREKDAAQGPSKEEGGFFGRLLHALFVW